MATQGQNPKPKILRKDSLLESLRDIGNSSSNSIKDEFLGKLPDDFFKQFGLHQDLKQNQPGESFEFGERDFLRNRLRRTEVVRRQEKLIFSSHQQETKSQVTALVTEVKKLSISVSKLSQNIQNTAFEVPPDPGLYHVTFFEKLISFIRILRQSVEDAANWTAVFNKRKSKKSYYWTQAGKSGTRFTLSSERTMATQSG